MRQVIGELTETQGPAGPDPAGNPPEHLGLKSFVAHRKGQS